MKTEVKKLERGRAELTVELTVEEYQPFLEKAAKAISASVKIPGFRPGQASLDIIKKKVGEEQVWQEALEPAVQKTLVKAIDDEKLVTIGSPSIEIVKLAPNNPVIYKAVVNLLPQVEVGDLTQISIPKPEVKIDEKKLEQSLDSLRQMRAKETLVNEAAKAGDKIEIDFDIFMDKVPVENGKHQNFALVIGEKSFIPGFEDQLIGLSKDQTKEFKLEFPKDYFQKNLAGRQADFKVTTKAVYHVELPQLNDEFAAQLGNFKTIDELKTQLRENLEHEAKHQADQQLEDEIMEKTIAASKFDDIPDILVDSETKKMMEELEHNLSHQGLNLDAYLTHLKKKREELMLDFAPQALKRVKSALILRAVGQTQKIMAGDQEIEDEVKQTLATYPNNSEAEKQINSLPYRDYLRNVITARKVIDYLKSVMVK
ncbi:MAG: trigger factor [Patescibacteria group bacterium]|jgi:trigger factor|nr:trigger factor [Patescibacteria group bacterium]